MKTIETTREGLYPMVVIVVLTIALLVMAFTWKSNNQISTKFVSEQATAESLQELVIGIKSTARLTGCSTVRQMQKIRFRTSL